MDAYQLLTSPAAYDLYRWLQLALLVGVGAILILIIRYLGWNRYSLSLGTRLRLFLRQTDARDYFDRLMRAQALLSAAEERQALLARRPGYPDLQASLAQDVADARQHLARIQHPRRLN